MNRHRFEVRIGTPFGHLEEEELAFIKRFVLSSGSLKEMAKAYRISYPTVRLRLDRLIAKIQVVDDQKILCPFERIARAKYAEGRIDMQTLKLLLDAHRQEHGHPQDQEHRHEDLDRR